MARDYTSDTVIAGIKRRGSIPTSQGLLQTSDFLAFINSEIESIVVPLILDHRQEYFVTYTDISVVAGTDTYDIPSDSIALGIREAVYVDVNGKIIDQLEQLSLEKVSSDSSVIAEGYYFLGNSVVIYPKPASAKTLRLYYHKDPNEVVASSDCGQITAIDTENNILTLSNVPSSWTTSDTIDVISSTPGFNTKATGVSISAISSPTVTVSSVENLSVGDWVALEGFTPIPQIPKNTFKIVEQAAVIKCLEALGKNPQTAEVKLNQYINGFSKVISPRSKGSAKAITSNGKGLFSNGSRYRHRS